MALTPAQLQTFATDIETNTNQEVIDALAAGNNNALRDWYNVEASPAVVVWKTAISVDEANDSIDWTEYMDVPVLGGDTLAGVKLATEQSTVYARQNNALNQLFRNGDFNPSLQTIRDALGQIFSGDPNTVAALLALAKRNALRIEVLFVTGPVQGAYVMLAEGSVSLSDVRDAVAIINA